MKVFSVDFLNELSAQAKVNDRLRQHRNIHQSYQESCQRLFNAIEPGSYIRPHRHASDPRDELLVAVRGLMALITFDDDGRILSVVRLGTEQYGAESCPVAELSSEVWHTIIAIEKDCVLLEIKAGPFDPDRPKDMAPWAPEDNTEGVEAYLSNLIAEVNRRTLIQTAQSKVCSSEWSVFCDTKP